MKSDSVDGLDQLNEFLTQWFPGFESDSISQSHRELLLGIKNNSISMDQMGTLLGLGLGSGICPMDQRMVNQMFYLSARYSKTEEVIKMLNDLCEQNDSKSPCYHYDDQTMGTKNRTLLFSTVLNESTQIADYLINQCKMDLNHKDDLGRNCLLVACSVKNNLHMVKYLIEEHQMDANSRNSKGMDCFEYICVYGSTDMMRYFLEDLKMDVVSSVQGYQIIQKNNHFHSMCKNRTDLDVIAMCVEEYEILIDDFAVYAAINTGHVDIIKYLIRHYISYPNYEKFKNQALMRIGINHVDVARYLVEDLNFNIEHNGTNAFLFSFKHSMNLDVIKYFAALIGQKIHDPDKDGKNCLMLACQYGQPLETIKYLVEELHIEPHMTQSWNNCLLLACYGYGDRQINVDVIKYLVEECKMDINSRNLKAEDCLMLIFSHPERQGYHQVFEYLLQHIDIGQGIQHIIDKSGSSELIKMIDIVHGTNHDQDLGFIKGHRDFKRFNELLSRIRGSLILRNEKHIDVLEHIGSKNPLLFDSDNQKRFNTVDPMKLRFPEFVNLIDQYEAMYLSDCVDLGEFTGMHVNKNNPGTRGMDPICHVICEPNQILFKHRGKEYYGHRKIVFGSIPVFECLIDQKDS